MNKLEFSSERKLSDWLVSEKKRINNVDGFNKRIATIACQTEIYINGKKTSYTTDGLMELV